MHGTIGSEVPTDMFARLFPKFDRFQRVPKFEKFDKFRYFIGWLPCSDMLSKVCSQLSTFRWLVPKFRHVVNGWITKFRHVRTENYLNLKNEIIYMFTFQSDLVAPFNLVVRILESTVVVPNCFE